MKTYYISELMRSTGIKDRFQLLQLLIRKTRDLVDQKDKLALMEPGAINEVLFESIEAVPEVSETQ
jgi:hypothetical protein